MATKSSEKEKQTSEVPNKMTSELKDECTIKLVITNMSQLRSEFGRRNSSQSTIAGVPWTLKATTESCFKWGGAEKDRVVRRYINVYIDCDLDCNSTLWPCDAIVQFKLLNQKDPAAHFINKLSKNFTNESSWGCLCVMEWKDIINPEKGYIKDDQVTLEAHILVQKIRGIRYSPMVDFTQPQPNLSDGVLVIGGDRLHVSKVYLAIHSPVFSTLFFGEFRERAMDEVPLEDVIVEEFTELLHVIYPSRKAITAANVEYLLKLGDRYDVSCVAVECERFLMSTDEIPLIKKLLWADQYQLARLHDVTMQSIKKAATIKELKAHEEFEKLSEATKLALFEKLGQRT